MDNKPEYKDTRVFVLLKGGDFVSHYYTEKTDCPSNEQKISISFGDKKFSFITDNGVFCKDYLDFGTRILLESVKIQGTKVLDLGCGYGTVGVILGQNSNLKITMVDINERSCYLAKKNVLANNVEAEVYKSNSFSEVKGLFDTIITNPPIRAGKKVVFSFYEGSRSHLIPGGVLYVVIQKKQGAESSIRFLTELFGNCEVIRKEKGYFILKSTK